ncbi:type 1 glutamine amidotransferase [Pseudonocardia acaciae]|uniref:type 1 glutamine amidotransferase n=1 Tax=Pseudonocardia acaciae TaxID=551276 RepID=UPI00048F3D95|nr:type 1 glutamine amidotransferase [Pseudonocardia acaciae]
MRVLFVQQERDDPPGLVGERLVELGARIEVADPRRPLPDAAGFDLVVPLGSVDSAADDSVPYLAGEWRLLDGAVRAGVPVFGICFGAQLLCRVLGGSVSRAPGGPEIGWMRIDVDPDDGLDPGPWAVWHEDVMTLPPAAREFARTAVGPHAYTVGPHFGVQFHPEATATEVAAWAQAHPGAVPDVDELLARMRADEADARRRVAALVDRVLAHAGIGATRR